MAYKNERRKSPILGSSLFCVFLIQCLFPRYSIGAEVFSLSPSYGSLCGETRILISGTGFSENKLSEGNQVQLVSTATSYDCQVSKDGTMESMIMCYTVPGMMEGVYYVRVIVDGVPIPDENMCQPKGPLSNECLFEVRKQNTPLIQVVSPKSFPPGPESLLALGGLIFTDRYGTNVAVSSNGKEETVNRVYAGPLACELKKTEDELYGLQLDSPNSNTGQITCRYQGTYIGNSNASFIIGDGPYGRSCRQLDTLLVSINKQIYQFQTFAEITGVSPSSGSTDGGTDLTIAGNYFTGSMENTKVYIAGEECEITSLTSTEIQCTSPPKPATLPTYFCGNRGLLLEVWIGTTKSYSELGDIEVLTSSDPGYSEHQIDQSSISHSATSFVSRTRGSFIAPYSGEYLFMIKSPDASSLRLSTDSDPGNKVEIAKCESTCPVYESSPGQTSDRVVLTENQKYYMEVLQTCGSSSCSPVQVAARYFDTELTNQSTGIVNMEHQLVKVTSTVVREVQKVKMEGVAAVGDKVNEVQVIEVTELSGGFSDATYRLGLYGVYTEPFTSTSTSKDFEHAFENLPWYMDGGETVGVKITQSTSPEVKVTLEIQFFTNRGDIPTLEFLQTDGSQGEKLDIQITEKVKGNPQLYTFALQMEGIISPLILPVDDEIAVISKIDKMFTTRCPKFLGQTGQFHQSFEVNGGTSGGEWMNDREAFCGRGLVKNPTYLYLNNDGLYLDSGVNTICFGYHGAIRDTLRFKYSYMDEAMTLIENNEKSFTISIGEESDEWKYTCFDILSALSSFKSNGQLFRIQYIKLSRAGDLYVDEVYIGKGPSTEDQENVNLLRLKPVMPNGHRIHYTQGTVTSVSPVYSVEITFFPLECGHDFPLLSVVPEQTNALKVEVERLSAASPPVTGTFTLTFEGQESVAISPTVTGEELKEILMTSVPNMGEIYTYRHGDCANFDLSIAFLSRPGDLETIQFSSQLSGSEVSMTVEAVADGSLNLDPIQGDMLCSYSTSPQVTVFVNDIPARCSASSPSTGCSFNWDPASTPTISSCSTTGSDIVISGSGFSSSAGDITVKIGGVSCDVTAATETEITCTASPQTPAGNRKVNVFIAGKGKAALADGATCRFLSILKPIVSVNPSSCSAGGRCLMTITGGVFSADVSITINNKVCEIKEFTNDVIKCMAPSGVVDNTVELIVSVEDQSVSFNVAYVLSPFVDETSITLTEEIIDGALVHRLEFIGINWVDGNTVKLFIGENEVTPVTVTGSFSLEATFDLLPSGTYSLELQTEDGNAVDSSGNIPSITVEERQITNVFPATGSLRGGTKLTISGQGFNTLQATLNKVKVGSHDCMVESSTSSELKCQIADTGRTHLVTNDGIHPSFGISGYAWEPKNLQVKVGDTVQWQWKFAPFITGMKVRVVQIKGLLSQEEEEGGFNSGPANSEGGYQFQFLVPGTYHYWSDFVDFYTTTHFSGVVEVLGVESYSAEVHVMLNDIEFSHVKPGTPDPSPTGTCPGTVGDLGFCTAQTPPAGDPNKHTFGFWNCATPTITEISLREGTTFDTIEIKGQGVNVNTCELEVKFYEDMCTVQGIGDSGFFCTVDSGNNPTIGVLQEISVLIKNRGYALIDIEKRLDRSFALFPAIRAVSPQSGSTAGGTFVTISGTGFPEEEDKVIVSIGGYICHVESSSSTEIICKSSAQTVGLKDVEVMVITTTGSEIMAVCKHASGQCTFSYSSSATPELTSVTPDAITGTTETTLTLMGSNLRSSVEGATVLVGSQECAVQSQSVDTITCTITNLPLGQNEVSVDVAGFGSAISSLTVTSPAIISSMTPVLGSVYGGTTITFMGNGFTVDASVDIGGVDCEVKSASLSGMECITGAKVAGSYPVNVEVGSVTYPEQNYEYKQEASPEVTSITPSSGGQGVTVTIVGQNFVSPSEVTIGEAECTLVSETAVEIECTTTPHAVGLQNVVVETQHGISNQDVQYEYVLSVASFDPLSGSIFGGQEMNINGEGFDENVEVRICDEICPVVDNSLTVSALVCKVPPSSDGSAKACDVKVSSNSLLVTAGTYNYEQSMTPTITDLSPKRGGTGGGSRLTITGSGFGTDTGSVLIDGSTCAVNSWAVNTIECTTDTHEETGTYKVTVLVPTKGIADAGSLEFSYIDLWSSQWTWGGGSIPLEGELVVIREGHTVLLDVDTPILNTLLIDGGNLIFDEKDLELQAHKILITKGGKLQVGTESEPFSSRAFITLHGHVRSKELPVYGTKMIGVRNGSLELHGKRIVTTWTRLENTASAGATEIVLTHPVDWVVGDVVVIATTNHRHRQQETEQRTISSVSADKRTLTLDLPLSYEHLGVTGNYGGQDIEFRAEVGLLSRTITFRGTVDEQWNDVIEQCPDGFDTGEFAVRSCFNGLFGEEIGVDQFGAHIILHAPQPDSGIVHAHIEYVEFHYVGQAFRLGRYPVHFHLNGDMTGSYVRGCSFHQSFNRAVNVHGTHNVLVEYNVAYNIMGGAMFLEDGIETGNSFQYNLMLFVIASSSLQNDDNSPAAFWVTNPDNIVQHNAVAGGTHFGFWYRMHEHPSGPSFTTSICPQKVPIGTFFNNTVHSNGWFGLWVFQRFTPREGGTCGSATPKEALFSDLTAWNCEKGAEIVDGGSVRLRNFVLVNNKLSGYEGKMVLEGSQVIENALIVGHASELTTEEQGCTRDGIKLPYGYGFHVKDVTFVNFDMDECAAFGVTRITGTCSVNCGGYSYTTEGLTFNNSPYRGKFFWAWEVLIKDLDGSLTMDGPSPAAAGKTVLPNTGTLPSTCTSIPSFSMGSAAAVVCPSELKYHRFTFNNVPRSLEGKDAIFTNAHGSSTQPYRSKAITHKKGWLIVFLDGMEYDMDFADNPGYTNFTFKGRIDNFETKDEFVILKQNIQQEPSRFFIDWSGHIPKPDTAIDVATSDHGHWEYAGLELKYLVRGYNPSSVGATTNRDIVMNFEVYKCFFEDCKPPPDPNTVPPKEERPDDAVFWSVRETWSDAEEGWGGYKGVGLYDLPVDGDSVKIPKGKWVVGDTTLPQMEKLVLYGVLELDDDGGNRNFELRCKYIIIRGGRLIIGWPNKPFLANALVILEGDRQTEYFEQDSGPTIGAKVLAAFGGVDMHGIQKGDSWTRLAQTASPGDTQITLESAVEWAVGDEIIIAPTGYKPEEVERFFISAISADSMTITLDGALQFKHIAHIHTAGGKTLTMAAEVGRLTRNIRFEGAAYPDMEDEAFGARIMVSRIVENGQLYIGYARLSNVEFRYTGQEGWVERGDARNSLAFTDAGTVNPIKPSYVKHCSFHKSFAPAITVHGTNNLPIEWNVMADSVWFALETTSSNTLIAHNFVTNVRWDGCFNGRFENMNVRYNGAFNLNKASNLVLEYNAVGGAQRVGYNILGEECGVTSVWKDNVAHTTLLGVANFQLMTAIPEGMDCIQINNFHVWKNLDYGIYFNNLVSSVIEGVKAADNGVNIFQFIIGPAAVNHEYENKYAGVVDSLIIGTSDAFDCSTDVPNANDCNIKLSTQSRAHSPRRLGITMPTFSSGGNKAPEKPIAGIKAYQAIGGQGYISGVTFSKFSDRCSGRRDMVIAPNFQSDDGNHRMEVSSVTLVDVDEESKVFYPRSNLGLINPSDCVDMACDAKIKTLLVDTDGSFLGQAGSVIPQSEYQWNGDPAYMLGDYRVPKEMQVTLDGERIPLDTLAPHKGIIRDDTCTYVTEWQAYRCPSFEHYTLTIESMDKDTETRRISPVAILGDGYLDLINGPQDHGWCSGYTCRKRLSTFQSIVALNKDFLIHYTGTSPQQSRFMMLDVEENDCIQLSIWYSQPWRLDVYHDDQYILPANARHVGDVDTIVYDPPPVGEPDKFKPSAATCANVSGSNFYDRDAGILTILIKGPKPVRIVTVDSVIVSLQFPPMSLEDFFGENIIMNIAAFLDIDPKFVRVTDIVRESTGEKRRRRTVDENIVGATIEVSNPPGTPTDTDSLTKDELEEVSVDLINGIQLTNFSQDINMNSNTVYSISRNIPETDSEEWQQVSSSESDGYLVVQVADHMIFHTELEPLHEGAPFKIQPKIQVVDKSGEIIKVLGAEENTWKLTAVIREGTGNPSAALLGTTTVQFVNGMATFTDLAISHFGTDYILDFTVSEPDVGEPFVVASERFTLVERPIVAAVESKTTVIVERSAATITLELRDAVTNQIVDDIDWRGHSWEVTANIGMQELYEENIMDSKTTTFDANSGQATFDNLMFYTTGVFVVQFNITSTPADYSIQLQEIVVVRGISQQEMTTEVSKEIGLKFEADYDRIVGTDYNKYFAALVLNWVANTYTDVIPAPKLVYKGSIMVTFNMGGNEENITSTISSLCMAIQNGTHFTFIGQDLTLSGYMTVDGNKYYGVSCGVISSDDGTDSAMPIIIIVSVVGGLLIIAVIILITCMIYKTKISPRAKTHDLEQVLQNEKSFSSVRSYKQHPPNSTTLTGEKRMAVDYWKM